MADVANARAQRRERIQRRALAAGGVAHPAGDKSPGTYWDALLGKFVIPEDAEWDLSRYRIVIGNPKARKPRRSPGRSQAKAKASADPTAVAGSDHPAPKPKRAPPKKKKKTKKKLSRSARSKKKTKRTSTR